MTAARAVAVAVAVAAAAGCGSREAKPRPTATAVEVADAAAVPSAAASVLSWAEVEGLARPTIAPGPAAPLEAALALVVDRDVPEVLRDVDTTPPPDAIATLPPELARAVAGLVTWAQAEGRLPTWSCDPSAAAAQVATVTLARVALALAGDDGDAPSARAVLYLADRLRAEGPHLLAGAIGTTLAGLVRQWAVGHGHRPAPWAARYDLSGARLVRVIAAEAVCSMRLVATADEAALAGEVAAVRGYWQDTVTAYRDRPADPSGTDARLAARDAALRASPERHPILATVIGPTVRVMTEQFVDDNAFRTWRDGP